MTFMIFTFLCLSVNIMEIVNKWPEVLAGYPTQMPFSNFITQLLISMAVSTVVISLVAGLVAGSSVSLLATSETRGKINPVYAAGLGLLIAGALAVSNRITPQMNPVWISLDGLNSYLPELGTGLSGFTSLILYPAFGLVLFKGIDIITAGWTKSKFTGILLFILAGLGVMATGYHQLSAWLISGLFTGLFMLFIYLLFIRIHFEWIPVSMGLLPVFKIIPVMIYNPFRGAVTGGAIFIIISVLFLYFWYTRLIPDKKSMHPAD